ncbi:hypothetical protein QUB70_25555 [Microcoleus sp. A003_D6]|uniref:hypothetical protein n=1 Tax=Microcoleus sp. A003_D6 TaxID=3055266 RepID=UPI002FD62260
MNNPLPDPGQNNLQSQFNDFLQSLGIDTPHTPPHSDPSLPHNNLPDYSQQHNFVDSTINQPGIIPDFPQTAWVEPPQQYNLPDRHHDWHQTSGVDPHHLNQNQWHEPQQVWTLNSSYTTSPGTDDVIKGPHIDIRDSGHIYLHQLNGETVDVGYVRGHAMYNSSGWEVGYFKDNGEVYKYNYSSADNCIGKVENGHIYNVEHKEIGRADTNLEGAAHLLFAVGGGAKT